MSFLFRSSTPAIRTLSYSPKATFSISSRFQKSVVDHTKDALKSVDRTVSDAAVTGIDKSGKFCFIKFLHDGPLEDRSLGYPS